MLDILSRIYSFIWQIWSSLTDDQKERICQAYTELMDEIFRQYFRNNGGKAQ